MTEYVWYNPYYDELHLMFENLITTGGGLSGYFEVAGLPDFPIRYELVFLGEL